MEKTDKYVVEENNSSNILKYIITTNGFCLINEEYDEE